ncbi:BZIP domain-containing protein [Psidium guajava]|nr:BZIP domain-containing protein [Psidium guajava]
MASSSGNSNSSSGTTTTAATQIQNSSSEEDVLLQIQRKRKRMESNRESARRSRMRKQRHLDGLAAEVGQLRKDNDQIISSISITTHHLLGLEAENSILRAQALELSHRLQSLNDILGYLNTTNLGACEIVDDEVLGGGVQATSHDHFLNPLNSLGHHVNQPIMAASYMIQY